MKRKLVLLGLLVLTSGSLFAQNTVKISGKVQFVGADKKVSVIQNNGFERITLGETEIGPDHTYSLTVQKEKPNAVTITCCQSQSVRAWLEDEDMVINFRGIDTAKIRIKNPPYVYIQAGPKNELLNLANYANYRNYQNMIAISQAVYRSQSLDDKQKADISKDLYNMNNEDARSYIRYLVEHYGHLTSCVALLSALDYAKDSLLIETTLTSMQAKNPGSTVAQDYRKGLMEKLEKQRRMREGQTAPTFTFNNDKGEPVSLDSFKGKVVIIDFWASWCGPCRKEIPNLKKYYEEFKNNPDVAFLSVSIDAKEDDWRKAMAEEQMEWIQLLAPNSGREAMDKYQFRGIPFIVAIDKEGRIFRKHLRGEAVRAAIVDALQRSEKK